MGLEEAFINTIIARLNKGKVDGHPRQAIEDAAYDIRGHLLGLVPGKDNIFMPKCRKVHA